MSRYRSFKGTERAVAAALGGRRTGHLGGASWNGSMWETTLGNVTIIHEQGFGEVDSLDLRRL